PSTPREREASWRDLDACVLSGGGGVAAGNVIGNVTVEKFVKAMANRARRRNRMTGDFSDAYQIAVARGNENFLGRVEVFGAQRLFDNVKTAIGRASCRERG